MAGQQYVLLEGHLVVDMRKTLTEEKDASRTATQGGNWISSFSVNCGLLILGRRLGIWQSTQGLRC
jgi:hypothetical protein